MGAEVLGGSVSGGEGRATGFQGLIGENAAFRAAVARARRVAEHPATTVLVQGETGTGKELFARAIHRASSNSGEPFVAINCSAIPEALLESELFGHERGAFTDARTAKRGLLEVAAGGTMLLDEVNELPMKLQPKLLRVLEERRVRRLGGVEEYDVRCRVVAATNVDLAQAVPEGGFREDLYYRLNVFRIEIPPLRERGEDVELLAMHFLEHLCLEEGLVVKQFTPEALDVLRRHPWPGNIREVKNAVESMLIVADGPWITPEHVRLQQRWTPPPGGEETEGPAIRVPPDGITLEEAERQILRQTLVQVGGNRTRAAQLLGVSRPTVIRKIRKYELEGVA